MAESVGTLYLCATPIGNLEDMTPRALRMLREANLIAAEDTRHTRQLLNHFDIHGTLLSYHEHNKEKMGPVLLEHLKEGKTSPLFPMPASLVFPIRVNTLPRRVLQKAFLLCLFREPMRH